MSEINIFWFRRDLRLFDNHGFYKALQNYKVLPIFIFDKNILNKIENQKDQRLSFIYDELIKLKQDLEAKESTLIIIYDTPINAFRKLQKDYSIKALYYNHDYEPYAIERDQKIAMFLKSQNIPVYSFKDQVIFDRNEIIKSDGKPYTIFTPYAKKWKEEFGKKENQYYPSENVLGNLYKTNSQSTINIKELGFEYTKYLAPPRSINRKIIKDYQKTRDIPSINGTSKLSLHLRFGTISIRQLINETLQLSVTYLNELIWREFYMMILYHFPHVVDHSFKSNYEKIEWHNDEKQFDAWCNGKTGYPIVDAGMRELNDTGFMHNRLRMITASFLTKHLLIDWRWGEAYFAQKLMDYELSSNNGGWQWAASTGCDAVPYFRIFNPTIQTKRFDPNFEYIRKWVPEYSSKSYPKLIIDHAFARERALKTYKKTKQ